MNNKNYLGPYPSLPICIKFKNHTLANKKTVIGPSALSRSITIIEEDYEVFLFDRSGRTISIIEYGKEFYEKSLVLINHYNDLLEESQ